MIYGLVWPIMECCLYISVYSHVIRDLKVYYACRPTDRRSLSVQINTKVYYKMLQFVWPHTIKVLVTYRLHSILGARIEECF